MWTQRTGQLKSLDEAKEADDELAYTGSMTKQRMGKHGKVDRRGRTAKSSTTFDSELIVVVCKMVRPKIIAVPNMPYGKSFVKVSVMHPGIPPIQKKIADGLKLEQKQSATSKLNIEQQQESPFAPRK